MVGFVRGPVFAVAVVVVVGFACGTAVGVAVCKGVGEGVGAGGATSVCAAGTPSGAEGFERSARTTKNAAIAPATTPAMTKMLRDRPFLKP